MITEQQNHYESEQSVLGGLMLVGDLNSESCQKVLSMLKSNSFYTRQHQIIYSEIKKMSQRGEYLDAISLDASLTRSGQNDQTGGFAYLVDLCKIANISNYVAHAKIVRESSISRVINSKLNDAIAMVNDNDGRSVYEKVGELESMISSVLERSIRNDSSGLVHASEICDRWSKDLEDRFENPESQSGYSTGISGLDKLLKPKMIRKGSLVVVGARPKMGKTALLGTLVKQFALEHKKATAVFSLEMPSDQIMERMLCERANVNGSIFYEGANNDSDFAKVSQAMGEYINSKLYMDDTPAITIQHIQKEVRRLGRSEDIGLIAVDYLTLMDAEKADRNDLAYGKITKALKNLAKELNCVVLLLTQLNRSLEQRTNKRPMPSDSRDTGQIEQDCDLWLGLYRHSVYDEDVPPEGRGLTEVIVRLNRHGDTGTAYLNLKNGYFEDGIVPTGTSDVSYEDEY